jgi:dCMP deaminase
MTHPRDQFFMSLAKQTAQQYSTDRSTRVGCVIVNAHDQTVIGGANSFPRGVDLAVESRHVRPAKYLWTEHAERNAIYTAAASGIRLSGCRLYLPWFPCVECARAIIQAGIVELIAYEPDLNDKLWGEGFAVALDMFRESGVSVRYLDKE